VRAEPTRAAITIVYARVPSRVTPYTEFAALRAAPDPSWRIGDRR
jgi:hypothetical protein